MRIRTIKPEWLDDERMVLASSDARVTSIALILMADDYGNGRANERLLTGRIFPGESVEKIRECLSELSEIGFVELYEVRGQAYYSICNWSKHQRVDKPGKPRVPGPCEASENIRETPGNFPGAFAPDHDHDPDPEHRSTTPARASRETIPAPPVQTTRHAVSAAFAREYEQRRALLWNASAHMVETEGIAEWVDRQAEHEGAEPKAVAARLLENWFAHKWGQKCDFKPRELLKCIGEVYAPPVVAPENEPDPEAINARRIREHRQQQQRELEAKLNGHSETAAAPPALEELMAGIGRRA